MPILETVPPGGKGWPNKGLEAKKRLIASSALNSIKSRLVIRKMAEQATTVKKRNKVDQAVFILNILAKMNTGINAWVKWETNLCFVK